MNTQSVIARPRRTRTLRLALAFVALVGIVTSACVSESTPSQPVPVANIVGEPCMPGVGVTVVVDFQALDDRISIGCAVGPQTDGLAALTNAGFTINYKPGAPASTICQINNQPTAGYPVCWLQNYWSYWKSDGSKAWSFSEGGVAAGPLPIDSFEGWSYSPFSEGDITGLKLRRTVNQIKALRG